MHMTRGMQQGIAIASAIVVVAIFFIIGNPIDYLSSLQSEDQSAATSLAQGGLVAQDQVQGSGEEAQLGDTVYVNYVGRFENGTVFDTSVGKPPAPGCEVGFCFVLGTQDIISGWNMGLQGMKVGGKRLLIVPPELGYGSQAFGPIPANSTLIFEVELLKVRKAQ
jgi:FKBP-type peptidyl-prolyl cis-trans isomerase FkpA